VDAEWVSLAQTAATSIVAAMGTSVWDTVRTRVARLIGRGVPELEATAAETLDEDLHTLTGGDDPTGRAAVEVAWAARLKDVLRPEAGRAEVAAQLRDLIDKVSAVTVTATGVGGFAVGGDMSVRAGDHGVAAGSIQTVNMPHPPVPVPVPVPGPGQA
jgi:hypothetical protein